MRIEKIIRRLLFTTSRPYRIMRNKRGDECIIIVSLDSELGVTECIAKEIDLKSVKVHWTTI